jgi:hypothetical protein
MTTTAPTKQGALLLMRCRLLLTATPRRRLQAVSLLQLCWAAAGLLLGCCWAAAGLLLNTQCCSGLLLLSQHTERALLLGRDAVKSNADELNADRRRTDLKVD